MNGRIPFFLMLLASVTRTVSGYGEKTDSLLLWQERAVLVLTDACRMAPVAFRDRYIGNTTIMLPEKYPAVPPLYWNRELNAAARYHCVEMGLSCGMVHECNGISFGDRVKTFYTKSSTIGENIAMGYQTPQQVVFAWLIDGQSAATAAPDGNGDGHRANIMSSRYREIGCGYYLAGSGKTAKPYWCQDFGGGKSAFAYHPVAAASHLFFDKGQTTFWAALYDTAASVATLSLLLDGTRHPLTLDLGTARAGTYAVSLPTATSCRSYSIEATLVNGQTIRYPETGTLVTVGEGTCTETSATAPRISRRSGSTPSTGTHLDILIHNGKIIFSASPGKTAHPVTTSVFDCCGMLRATVRWSEGAAEIPLAPIGSGLLLFVHSYADGSIAAERRSLVR